MAGIHAIELVLVSRCIHGFDDEHYTCDTLDIAEWHQRVHDDETCLCEGGSRKRLTINVEAGYQEAVKRGLFYFSGDSLSSIEPPHRNDIAAVIYVALGMEGVS